MQWSKSRLIVAGATPMIAALTAASAAFTGIAMPAVAHTQTSPPAVTVTYPQTAIGINESGIDIPAQVQAGTVQIGLANNGTEAHSLSIARLNPGVSMDDLQQAMQGSPEAALGMLTFVGGAGTVEAGNSQQVVLKLQPGNYLALDFNNLDKGLIKPFQVVASNTAAGPDPAADLTVETKEFKFVLPEQITAGKQTWKVTNVGEQAHHLNLMKLQEGKTVADLAAFMQSPDGPPPVDDLGGVEAISTGNSEWTTFDLSQPGDYILVCFMPDAATGKAHAELGMVTPFTVTAAATSAQ